MSSTKDEWVSRGGFMPQADDLKRRQIEQLVATLQDESVPAEQRAMHQATLLEIHASMDDEFTDNEGDD
jgi:hypothetical protein